MVIKKFEDRYKPVSLSEHFERLRTAEKLTREDVINLVTAFLFKTLSVNPEGNNVEAIKIQAQESLVNLFSDQNPTFGQKNFRYAVEMLVDIWATSQIFWEILLQTRKYISWLNADDKIIIWDVGSGIGVLALASILWVDMDRSLWVYLIDHNSENFEIWKKLIWEATENNLKSSVVGVWADVSWYPQFHAKPSIPSLFSTRLEIPNIIIAEIIDTNMPSIDIQQRRVLIGGKELGESEIDVDELIKDPYPFFLDSLYKTSYILQKQPLIWPFPGESLIYNKEAPEYQKWGIKSQFSTIGWVIIPLPLVGFRFWDFQHFLRDPSFFTFRWADKNLKREAMRKADIEKCDLFSDSGEIGYNESKRARRIIVNYLRLLLS